MDSLANVGQVVLYGVGLINGSLGLALREHGFTGEIVGAGRRQETLVRAMERGAIDRYSLEERTAVAAADVVVVGTPVDVVPEVVARLAEHAPPDAIFSDVGSVKESVLRRCAEIAPTARFVGAHPIAGSEHSGVDAARADLFRGATCVLTPTSDTDPTALARIAALWSAAGARTLELPPDVHDVLLAASSHLPHVAACALVHVAASCRKGEHASLDFAGSGFADITRVAEAPSSVWEPILRDNAHALSPLLRGLAAQLTTIAEAIEDGRRDTVAEWIETASSLRRHWKTHHVD